MSKSRQKTMVARNNATRPISLHIERVVIEGGSYTAAQLGQLQGGLETELVHLLRAGGLPAEHRTETALRGQMPARPARTMARSPDELGRAMAQSLYKALQLSRESEP
jgi:hypothetical protein